MLLHKRQIMAHDTTHVYLVSASRKLSKFSARKNKASQVKFR